MANLFAKTLIGFVALGAASTLSAQSAKELFEEGSRLMRTPGKKAEALEKFQEVIKLDPSNTEAFELFKSTDQAIFEEMLAQKGEYAKIAQFVLLRARQGRIAYNKDDAKIRELVTKACAKDYATYATAMEELRAKHGAYAVPRLVGVLSDADADDAANKAIMALHKIGGDAALPLIQALQSDNATTRKNVCTALNLIGDARAKPALARLVKEDADNVVRDIAGRALRRMGVTEGANPLKLYEQMAADYLSGKMAIGSTPSEDVWRFVDGKVVATPAPVFLYWSELAKQCAEQAMQLDPASPDAQSLLARSYLAQVALIDSAAAAGNEDAVALKGEVQKLRMVAMGMGPGTLGKAFMDSDAAGQPLVAVAAVEALGDTEGKDKLGESKLLNGLSSGSKAVAYASALALVKASRGGKVPQQARVVATLATAIGEEAVWRVKFIGEGKAITKVKAASMSRGNVVSADSNGRKAVQKLLAYEDADLVVINESLSDDVPETVLGLIKKNNRFQNTKFLLVASNEEKAQERFGDKVDGIIQGPIDAKAASTKVSELLKAAGLDPARKRAAKVAQDASAALLKLAQSRVAIAEGALGSIAAQLDRDDSVAIPAAHTLGESGSAANIEALAACLNGKGSLELKKAAATAAGRIFGRTGGMNDATFKSMLAVATGADDLTLRMAVVTAMGKASLNPAQRLALSKALRVTVSKNQG